MMSFNKQKEQLKLQRSLEIQRQAQEIHDKYPEFFNNLIDYCCIFGVPESDLSQLDSHAISFIYGKQAVGRELLNYINVNYVKLYREQLEFQDKRLKEFGE